MQARGLTAKVSSIHVNGWFGAYDKLAMTRTLLAEAFGIDLDRERAGFVFVGDSPNDAPMFAFFPHAVGVANVRVFADRIATLPAYVTLARSRRRVRGTRRFPACAVAPSPVRGTLGGRPTGAAAGADGHATSARRCASRPHSSARSRNV